MKNEKVDKIAILQLDGGRSEKQRENEAEIWN